MEDGDTDEFSETLRPITMNDLELALEKMLESRVHCDG